MQFKLIKILTPDGKERKELGGEISFTFLE